MENKIKQALASYADKELGLTREERIDFHYNLEDDKCFLRNVINDPSFRGYLEQNRIRL